MKAREAFGQLLFAVSLTGCGNVTGNHPAQTTTEVASLAATDVQAVVQSAANSVADPLVIAVVDRPGNVLAVYRLPGSPDTAIGNFGATVPAPFVGKFVGGKRKPPEGGF